MRQQVRKLVDDGDGRSVPAAELGDRPQGVVPRREGEPAARHSEVLARSQTQLAECLRLLLLERLVVEAADRLGEATQEEGLALSAASSDESESDTWAGLLHEVGEACPLCLPVEEFSRLPHGRKYTKWTLYKSTLYLSARGGR